MRLRDSQVPVVGTLILMVNPRYSMASSFSWRFSQTSKKRTIQPFLVPFKWFFYLLGLITCALNEKSSPTTVQKPIATCPFGRAENGNWSFIFHFLRFWWSIRFFNLSFYTPYNSQLTSERRHITTKIFAPTLLSPPTTPVRQCRLQMMSCDSENKLIE